MCLSCRFLYLHHTHNHLSCCYKFYGISACTYCSKREVLRICLNKCGWSTDMHLEPEKIWRGNENPLINSVSLPFWKFKALLTFKALKFVPFSTYEMKTTSKYNQRWNSFTYYNKIVNCVVIRWLSFITLMQIPFVCFFQYLCICTSPCKHEKGWTISSVCYSISSTSFFVCLSHCLLFDFPFFGE